MARRNEITEGPWKEIGETALRFRARLGGATHLCMVTYDALLSQFGSAERTTFLAFEKHRDAILARASKLKGRKKPPEHPDLVSITIADMPKD